MPRELAYRVLERVEDDEAFSNRALDVELAEVEIDERDRRLATRILYGVLTWRRALDAMLDDLVHGGIRSLDPEVLRILRIGLFQMVFLDRIPKHAVVDEAAEMTKSHANQGAVSLVNAVLREASKTRDPTWWRSEDRENNPVEYLGARYSMPNWIVNRMIQLYGFEFAEKLVEAFTERPALYIRFLADVDVSSIVDGDDQLAIVPGLPKTVEADQMTPSIGDALAEREAIIQDLGSQLVARFVGAKSGDRILDGCAGLGGKTLTMADDAGEGARVLAVDSIKWKVDKLARLAKQAPLEAQVDTRASELQDLTVDEVGQFDRVLIDAPCSALGVIRRHPEIKWHRRESDIPALVKLQESLLEAGARFVEPGGTLVYSVCTLTSEEGPKQVDSFLERHPDFERAEPPEGTEIDWSPHVDETGCLSLNPVDHDSDLFFAARLRRTD